MLLANANDDAKGPLVAAGHNNEEDKTAQRALLKETGFDPENVSKVCRVAYGWSTTPLMYFIKQGNFKMCRYLVSRRTDCRKTINGYLPMFWAAVWGRLEIMKLLYHYVFGE